LLTIQLVSIQKGSLRQQRRRETERAIVAQAMRLLAAEGLEGLSMRALARGVGCTEPALYRYFASKDALLAALTRQVVEGLGQLLEEAVATPAPEGVSAPLLQVALAAETYAAVMCHRPGEGTLLTLVLGDPRYLVAQEDSAPTVDVVAQLFGRVEALLAEAASAGDLEPGVAMRRAVALWTAAHGAAQLRKFDRFDLPHLSVIEVRHSMLVDLLTAWGADREAALAALEAATSIAQEFVPFSALHQE
jgi:AcrR family transcriptional regulator